MEPLETTPVGLDVRLVFSRAAVQVIGRRAGVRMLHIKGVTLAAELRAAQRSGTDVDVLVAPEDIRQAHKALVQHGWRLHSDFETGSPFGHARTYRHADWGYLDLHRRFPGVRIPDAEAFDLLWADRGAFDSAGIACAVPSVDAQAVLLVLNAARDTGAQQTEARALWARRTPDEHERRVALVRRLDSEVAFAAALGDLERYRRRPEYALWKSITQGGGRLAEWRGRLWASRSLQEAAQVVLRAPRVNRDALAHKLGRQPTRADLARALLHRARTAVREMVRRGRG